LRRRKDRSPEPKGVAEKAAELEAAQAKAGEWDPAWEPEKVVELAAELRLGELAWDPERESEDRLAAGQVRALGQAWPGAGPVEQEREQEQLDLEERERAAQGSAEAALKVRAPEPEVDSEAGQDLVWAAAKAAALDWAAALVLVQG